ncbi:hypothetical protein [Sphingomonas sp. Leaf205]|uniref:hypothetical protein n=1 Tax=Sphingomonas sp. Leaf205 TaxID=2876551 RepID=UPI001E587C70|nr:hypothetical protein [Sphingomonas sp. Leaf205]
MAKFQGAKATKPAFNPKASEPGKPVSTNTMRPLFSFEHMKEGGGYSVECCEQDDRASLALRLHKLGRMTWGEIGNAPRHGLGTEKIARSSMVPALPSVVTEETNLLAIRFSGMKPMVGFRDGRVFHILFLDKDFTAYPH